MGMVQLKDRKMSSRTGDVLTVDWLLDQIKERVEQLATEGRISSEDKDQTVEQIVIGAIKYSVLKVGTGQDAAFAIETSVALDGNSGPYIQYTYARTQSVLRKAEEFAVTGEAKDLAPEERELLRLLSRFPEIVQEAAERLAPNVVCTYLFEVAQAFNLFYQKHQILKADDDARAFRLSLTAATGETVKKGLQLLGIKAPEKM
jgi:arginyl-tRNA synthetase